MNSSIIHDCGCRKGSQPYYNPKGLTSAAERRPPPNIYALPRIADATAAEAARRVRRGEYGSSAMRETLERIGEVWGKQS